MLLISFRFHAAAAKLSEAAAAIFPHPPRRNVTRPSPPTFRTKYSPAPEPREPLRANPADPILSRRANPGLILPIHQAYYLVLVNLFYRQFIQRRPVRHLAELFSA
jgi:hypothetical protein